jgi:hypothetical protein
MRLRALTSIALLAAAVTVASQAPAQGTSAEVPLIRMRDGHNSDLLFRLNPLTLQQVGRPIRTFRGGTDLKLSPDGTRLAFADAAQRLGRRRARSARIHFVDLATWRSKGVARVGRYGWLNLGWVSGDRVVAAAGEGFGPQRLLWVDADTRKVVARRAYSGWTVNTLPVPGGLAVVLGPVEGVGPVRILLLDPNGGVRTIEVVRIRAGSNYDDGGEVLTPAVTVDPGGGRMYVVAARGLLVADVDLATGAVAYHAADASAPSDAAFGGPLRAGAKVGSSGRSLRARAAKGDVDVWWRHAAWAGDGRIVLTGNHWPRPRARRFDGPIPLGARVIDTRTWTVTTLDPRPDTIQVAGGMVLAAGTRYLQPGRTKSTGLLAFDEAGRRAWMRFRGRPVVLLGSRGEVVYAWARRARTAYVLDRATGRTLHTIRTGLRVPFLLSPP